MIPRLLADQVMTFSLAVEDIPDRYKEEVLEILEQEEFKL